MSKYLSFILPIIIAIAIVGAVGFVFYYERTAQPSFLPPPQGTQSLPQQSTYGQPQTVQQPGSPSQSGNYGSPANYPIQAKATGATYKFISSGAPSNGWFGTGQSADIMLSGIDFNNTGGPLSFNHLGGIASDGTHLIVADRNNNRVLIWNTLPIANVPPDVVLGQKNFTTNNPGTGLDQLDWPVAVAVTPDGKLAVADTYNNRILIWNEMPTVNDTPADIVISNGTKGNNILRSIMWPWGVWANGDKFAISSTFGGVVLVWNHFPTENNQPADYYLDAGGKMGTPRDIISDPNSNNLIIYDHNARSANCSIFIWKSFPTNNTPPDYCINSLDWFVGTFTPGGKFIGSTNFSGFPDNSMYIWKSFPDVWEVNAQGSPIGPSSPDLVVTGSNNFSLNAGDTSGEVVAGGKLYISLDNGDRIVVYNQIPASSNQNPDFAIGAPDIYTNPLVTNNIMSNPMPATDGKSLFVSSDFDNKLYVYKHIPDQSNAHPDLVYDNVGAWDNTLYNNTFAMAGSAGGGRTVYIWTNGLPTDGRSPDFVFTGSIGSATFRDLKGISYDGNYFYLSDQQQNKIYVWKGLPANSKTDPIFTITTNQPGRLSSDGKYLIVTKSYTGGGIEIYSVANLSDNAKPVAALDRGSSLGIFNLPWNAVATDGHLFVADTSNNRVFIWDKITDAIVGKSADIQLGCGPVGTICLAQNGANSFFWPSGLAFDGSYLWVGEFKFSERLLRFSIKP